jgi:hypothetical protein
MGLLYRHLYIYIEDTSTRVRIKEFSGNLVLFCTKVVTLEALLDLGTTITAGSGTYEGGTFSWCMIQLDPPPPPCLCPCPMRGIIQITSLPYKKNSLHRRDKLTFLSFVVIYGLAFPHSSAVVSRPFSKLAI